MEKIGAVLDPAKVDAYVVVNGQIIGATPWEGDAGYDFASTQWYHHALVNAREVIFTDV